MGRWEEIKTQVWDTIVIPCEACGQVVPKRLWVAEIDGTEHRFCSTRCEEIYRSYVLARQAMEPGTATSEP